MTGRRVCIAYSTFAEGRGLLAFVRDMVLTLQDTVYICHVFSKDHNGVSWGGGGGGIPIKRAEPWRGGPAAKAV